MKNTRNETMKTGEVFNYEWDFNDVANTSETTLSAATWAVIEGTSVTVGANVETGNVTQAPVTAALEGCSIVETAATMADGQIVKTHLHIVVSTPAC